MDDDIYATCLPYIEADWTKSETFDIMDMDKEVYKNSFQYQASFMAFRKSMRSIMFVEEWLNNCCNPDLINPAQNIGNRLKHFRIIEWISLVLAYYVRNIMFLRIKILPNSVFGGIQK